MPFVTKPCAHCGVDFTVSTKAGGNTRKYCSQACYHRSHVGRDAQPVLMVCATCGKSYSVRPSEATYNRYCSKACKDSNPERNQRYSDARREIPDQPCIICGTMFRPSQRAHPDGTPIECCSIACANLKRRKHQRVDRTQCEVCGKNLTTRQISNQSRFCSRACTGKANAQWHAVPENKDYMRDHGARTYAEGQKAPTNIERAMSAALDRARLRYVQQQQIGYYVCDFLLPDARIVIECDGTFWHSLPHLIARDKRKDSYLHNHGYTVLRFTEAEIKQDVDWCVQVILSHL